MAKFKKQSPIDLELVFIHEVDGAIKVSLHEESQEVWLPKSLIEYEIRDDREIVFVTLPEWLAREKGFV